MQNDNVCDVLKLQLHQYFSVIWEATDDSDSGFDFEESEVARGIRYGEFEESEMETINLDIDIPDKDQPSCHCLSVSILQKLPTFSIAYCNSNCL